MSDSCPSLRLIAIDDEVRRLLEEAPADFAGTYGASLGGNESVVKDVVAQSLDLLRKAPRGPEWGGFLVADREQAVVVGTCGFTHGPEADGSVEIAYFTFPDFEGRGYATAMARHLVDRSLKSEAVREVVAHTLPEPNASTRILEKVGLRKIGEAHDPDAGRVWRWAYMPPARAAARKTRAGRRRPTRERRRDDELRGRLRPHDPFELIRWLALSQPDPRKALAELVQNSLDAGARSVRVTRRRERRTPCLFIFDDGAGIIPELGRAEALKYIATHIGHSRKRSLSPQQRLELMTQGQYGIGLLGFWSLGELLELRPASARTA
jgi:RimJ/RimL family protein N-acetyltransferase